MLKIELDLNKSVEENAAKYFDEAKKAKKKLKGTIQAVEEFKKKKQVFDKKVLKEKEVEQKIEVEKSRKKFWFEKYKWFISSDNFLVIGGKDAMSNEEIIKKHVLTKDLVFHTEMPKSPFVIVKNDKALVPKTTLVEAAVFTGLNSKSFSDGMSSADVFMVKPEQVTKKAMSGEYLTKGSFMIYGKRENFQVNLELGAGIINWEGQNLVMVGPKSAINTHCEKKVFLKQGTLKKGEMSKKLMKHFNLSTNDDLLSQLPQGTFDLVKIKK